MQNRDKIIKEVAEKLNLKQVVVKEIVAAQAELIRETMQSGKQCSVYLRKVGTFIPQTVRERINQDRREGKLAPKKNNTESIIYNFKNNNDE